jgi:CheY-like chemotaxis protein
MTKMRASKPVSPNEALRASPVVNLTGAVTMVVDESPFSMSLTIEALRGFGVRNIHSCRNAAEAMDLLKLLTIDLMLVDCEMSEMKGHELVRWLRKSRLEPNSYLPVMMTASHVRSSTLCGVRDCGANFLVTRPFSPSVILERIVWVARDNRQFLDAGDYKGPDRRFKTMEPRKSGERRADMLILLGQKIDAAVRQQPLDGSKVLTPQ